MIDRKYKFVAVNPCNNHVITEENGIVFAAHDIAVPKMLAAYYDECEEIDCDDSQLESIALLIDRVRNFQRSNKIKKPDTDTPCEIDRCIGKKVCLTNHSTGRSRLVPAS